MSLFGRLRVLALALGVALAIAVWGAPAGAIEAPPGSRNFTPPGDVPNYFSNESGPFRGGATAHAAQQEAVPLVALPASRGGRAVASRQASRHHRSGHHAKAGGRTRLAHGKASGHRQVALAGAARRGHGAGSKVAHAAGPKAIHAGGPKRAHASSGHLADKSVAAKNRAAATKGKHPAREHG